MINKDKGYVYLHIRNDTNEIFYVGIGLGLNFKRAYESRGRNLFWKRITQFVSFTIKIVYINSDYNKVCNKEIRLIKLIGRKDLGLGTLCNLTDGGEGSLKRIVTIETRNKITNFQKGRIKSEETNLKLSKAHLGKILSKETKLKISNSKKGKIARNKSKPVICKVTLREFPSIKEAAIYIGIHKSSLAQKLRGDCINKTTLVYKNNFKHS